MNPLFVLIPLAGLVYYVWNRGKKTYQGSLAGTTPVQVLAASYDQSNQAWAITANVIQPNGDIATMDLLVPGNPMVQPSVTDIMAAVGRSQQADIKPTSMEF